MKTLSDIKRKMTLGSQWHCTHHGFSPDYTVRELGIRAIGLVQTNLVAFVTTHNTLSYFNFPKKTEVLFINNDTFGVMDAKNKTLLTYTFISYK